MSQNQITPTFNGVEIPHSRTYLSKGWFMASEWSTGTTYKVYRSETFYVFTSPIEEVVVPSGEGEHYSIEGGCCVYPVEDHPGYFEVPGKQMFLRKMGVSFSHPEPDFLLKYDKRDRG